MDNKAQVSFEYLIIITLLISLALFISILAVGVFSNTNIQQDIARRKENLLGMIGD